MSAGQITHARNSLVSGDLVKVQAFAYGSVVTLSNNLFTYFKVIASR